MGQVIWTEQAYSDLQAIYDYVAVDSVRYAKLLTDKLFDRTQILASFPEMAAWFPKWAIRLFAN